MQSSWSYSMFKHQPCTALAILTATLGLGGLGGCGWKTVQMQSAPVVARRGVGFATVKRAGERWLVEVEAYDLRAPQLDTPGAAAYVVWARPPSPDKPANVGALELQLSSDGFRQSGTLKTAVDRSELELFVTA